MTANSIVCNKCTAFNSFTTLAENAERQNLVLHHKDHFCNGWWKSVAMQDAYQRSSSKMNTTLCAHHLCKFALLSCAHLVSRWVHPVAASRRIESRGLSGKSLTWLRVRRKGKRIRFSKNRPPSRLSRYGHWRFFFWTSHLFAPFKLSEQGVIEFRWVIVHNSL